MSKQIMAWNEQGNGKGSGGDNDPWGRGGGGDQNDLDQIVQDWQKRFGGIVGGGKGGGGILLVVALVIAWLATGVYIVDEAEEGVVTRFGAYIEPPRQPGLRWHLPFPIEAVDKVNTEEINDYNFSTEMLTADEQYVFIDLVVQYRRSDPVLYSFEVEDPDITLHGVTESALRGVVGTSSLEELIGDEREQIPMRTMQELQQTLSDYGEGAGLTVTSINLNVVDYPKSVQEAVDDTQKARNDRDRYELEANTYRNDIIPRARGQAQRILQDAEAYRDRVIADAEGEAARFEALLAEYQKAPRVTRDRLYIEAVESVYGNSSKVIIDTDGNGNLLYLPMDQLLRRSGVSLPDAGASVIDSQTTTPTIDDSRSSNRERRTRQ